MTNKEALLAPGAKLDWETPEKLVRYLHDRFHFTLDVCASRDNVCASYFREGSLDLRWTGRCYCNPPYGPGVGDWIEHGVRQIAKGNSQVVVYLLPARTDTRWFQSLLQESRCLVRIEYLPGRLKFEEASHPAPFPSCLIILEPKWTPR